MQLRWIQTSKKKFDADMFIVKWTKLDMILKFSFYKWVSVRVNLL